MAKAIRIGIAGCGKIARVAHAKNLKKIRGAKIVSLLDIVPEKIDELRAMHDLDAEGYTDFKKFLNSDLDAICVCTPNVFHYPMTMAALKAGMHVLCEKPVAATLPEATRMIAAAKKAKKVLHINQTLRYMAEYQTIAKQIEKGVIGDVIHARVMRAARDTPNHNWSPGADWFVSSEYQGGMLLDIGIHMADVLKWYCGEAVEVSGRLDTRTKGIDVPDNVNALFRFKSGATGVMELSWTVPTAPGLLEIYGTKGTIRMGVDSHAGGGEKIMIVRPGKPNMSPPLPKRVTSSFQSFINAVNGKAPSPTPGELGRNSLALCDAIAKSSASGKLEKVKHYK